MRALHVTWERQRPPAGKVAYMQHMNWTATQDGC